MLLLMFLILFVLSVLNILIISLEFTPTPLKLLFFYLRRGLHNKYFQAQTNTHQVVNSCCWWFPQSLMRAGGFLPLPDGRCWDILETCWSHDRKLLKVLLTCKQPNYHPALQGQHVFARPPSHTFISNINSASLFRATRWSTGSHVHLTVPRGKKKRAP